MRYHVPEKLHHDRREIAIVDSTTLPWTPSPQPGVERRFLEREGGESARATSIVRYAPQSSFSPHVHEKGEEFLVLEGVFSDEHGDFAAGTYVRNPPGSRHTPFTREGCTIFVKLRQMADDDRTSCAVNVADLAAQPTAVPGVSRIPLYRDGSEDVAIEILGAGVEWRAQAGGQEILVLEGELRAGDQAHGAGSWLRHPSGREPVIASMSGCRYWVKRGHLRP